MENPNLECWSNGSLRIQHSNTPTLQYSDSSVLHHSIFPLLFEARENLCRILVENLLFLFAVQPRDAFDLRPHVVVPSPRSRIGLRAGAGSFGAEQAAIRTDDFEQQFKRLHIVERRVEIELAQPLVEIFRVFRSAQLRAPPAP